MTTGVLARGAAGRSPAMDPRMAARVDEVARGRSRRRARRRLWGLLVVLVVAAAFALVRSPLLDVDHVRVAGAERTDREVLLAALGIAPGRPLASIDEAAAAERLRALPWVDAASVSLRWPGTVRVRVTEREAVVVVGTGRSAVLVDATGRALAPAGADDAEGLPTLDVGSVEPGERLHGPSARLAAVVADLPAALRAEVAEVAERDGAVDLELHDGIEVRLGEGTRLRTKGEAVLALLDQAGRATIDTIDVTVPGAAALTRRDGGGA